MSTFTKALGSVITLPMVWLARAVDPPLRWWQRKTGQTGMAAAFLAPNLLIFGIFVLFPLALNVVYSTNAGTNVLLADRTFVGADQYARLLDCKDYTRAITCREDLFWRAAGNTFFFVVLQVSMMVVVSTITALILNRNIAGRGFFRAVFFFPVLLSPVVVGLIWR